MKEEIAPVSTNQKAESKQRNYGDGDAAAPREMQVISFVTHIPKGADGHPQKIDYPELNQMLNHGYEIWDVLATWGSGDNYFVTFVLRKWEKKPVRNRLGFDFSAGK